MKLFISIFFPLQKQKTVQSWQREIAETQCDMPLKTSSFFVTTQ